MRGLFFAALYIFAIASNAEEALNMIGRQSQNEGMTAVPATKKVVIDGKLDEWDLSGQIRSFSELTLRDRFSVRSAAMWDAENLYLSFDWRDPFPLNSTIDPEVDAAYGWKADAIQLRVRAGGQVSWVTLWSQGADRPVFQIDYWKKPDHSKHGTTSRLMIAKRGQTTLEDGVESAYTLHADRAGFTHEVKIPWAVLHMKPHLARSGETIQMGIEFIWGDVTGASWPLHRYADNMAAGTTSRHFFWTKVDSWGEVVLADRPVAEVRRYRAAGLRPAGTIPVRAELPPGVSAFTLLIEDASGNRIRNLAADFAAADFGAGGNTVEVLWDGLDDAGNPVVPGTYRVRGLSRGVLSARYELCYFNPGTPPWETGDGRGSWGSDHSKVEFAARSGERMVLGCGFVEGGYGLWALGADGKKIWSDRRGMTAMAANDRYVYTVPAAWDTTEPCILRFDAATGKYMPFILNGKERPLPLPLKEELGETQDILALAANAKYFFAALPGGRIVAFDGESGRKIAEYRLDFFFSAILNQYKTLGKMSSTQYLVPLAADEESLWFFRGGMLGKLELSTGKSNLLKLDLVPEEPSALAIAPNGDLLVAERGAAQQLKRYSRDGKLLLRYGRSGGRALQGKYDRDGVRNVTAVAADARNRVWATEYTDFPRRVSVWRPEGAFEREYIGNTEYSGSGAFLHDSDPQRAYWGPNEVTLDYPRRVWEMNAILWNPPEAGDPVFRIHPGSHSNGHIFRSRASGVEHEYYFVPAYRDWGVKMLLMKNNGNWRPVAAIGTVGNLTGTLDPQKGFVTGQPGGEFADCDPYDSFFWNDRNGDGRVQRAECEILKARKPGAAARRGRQALPMQTGWGQRVDPDTLSFYASDERKTFWRYSPSAFTPEGAPVYTNKTLKRLGDFEATEAVPVPGEDTVLTFRCDEKGKFHITGADKNTGKLLWSYPSLYHFVHGSHKAPMAQPGLLIGPLKITGVAGNCGEAGNVFLMRGNLGQDFLMTTDGLYVGALFQDRRLPVNTPPPTEEALVSMPMELFSMGGEPFNGWFGRQSDGKVRMTCGIAPQAAMVLGLDGLDTLRRLPARELTVDSVQLAAAAFDRARRAQSDEQKTYTVMLVKGTPDWTNIPALPIRRDGQTARSMCRMAYTPDKLHCQFIIEGDSSPWKNTGSDLARLFKTGDAVDLQLSPSGNSNRRAVAGDLRLVVAPYADETAAVLMRRVAPEAKSESVTYRSPVTTLTFDSVRRLAPELKVLRDGDRTIVEFAVLWKDLGIVPKAKMKMRGDAGIILSDPAGGFNIARLYWANSDTNLVNDTPLEADLFPNQWGEFVLGD